MTIWLSAFATMLSNGTFSLRQKAFLALLAWGALGAGLLEASEPAPDFPLPLARYADSPHDSLTQVLVQRIQENPFNLVASMIFLLAIGHTFLAPMITRQAHYFQRRKEKHLARLFGDENDLHPHQKQSLRAALLHFLGEVETVFGLWAIPLGLAIVLMKGTEVARNYLNHSVNYTEPMFVVVVMAMASSRPILQGATRLLALLAGNSPAGWWLVLLTVGPLLGSLITEPAAMTICALLLGREFYRYEPSSRFRYATLGLLFVNVSVGGTLTHFAAPPVLMVSEPWQWDSLYMIKTFGGRAVLGIVLSNLIYFLIFRGEFLELARRRMPSDETSRQERVPFWITGVHLAFLVWTVIVSHEAALFIGGFLFFLGFTMTTLLYQDELNLRGPLLVGFFLAGLVVHGGLQGWWIEPVLTRLGEVPLLFGATALTSVNDNAAITYLATLVPNFSESLKIAVMSGAVCGGGLTVIANAPNPAGQSLLSQYFPEGITPGGLFLAALLPTLIMLLCFGLGR